MTVVEVREAIAHCQNSTGSKPRAVYLGRPHLDALLLDIETTYCTLPSTVDYAKSFKDGGFKLNGVEILLSENAEEVLLASPFPETWGPS